MDDTVVEHVPHLRYDRTHVRPSGQSLLGDAEFGGEHVESAGEQASGMPWTLRHDTTVQPVNGAPMRSTSVPPL